MFGASPRRSRRLLGPSTYALADQALISAANFVTFVVLARTLRPAEFGTFVLAYTGLLLLGGLQTALITQAHNVLGQQRQSLDYRLYTSSTFAVQIVFSASFAAAAAFAAALATMHRPSWAPLLLVLVPAIIGWQFQEFARRVLYTEGRTPAAFAIDLIGFGGQVGVIAATSHLVRLDAAAAMAVVAATSLAGAASGLWIIRDSLGRRVVGTAFRENWAFGKWLAAAIGASWFSGHALFYLTAILVGTAETGALKASQAILGPLSAFFLFLSTSLPIRFAETRATRGEKAFAHHVRRAYVGTLPAVVVGCVCAAALADVLLDTLYGDAYRGYGNLVRLFALYYLVIHLVYVLTAALTALEMTRLLFAGSAFAAIAGLLLGWIFIATLGVTGAVVGLITGAGIVAVAFWWSYSRVPGTAEALTSDPCE